ncbi:MAG TPA: tetratricopeptide repeat protein, partial [Polyangia bacterium]
SPRVIPFAAARERRRPLAWMPVSQAQDRPATIRARMTLAQAGPPIASNTAEKKKAGGRPGEFELAELISLADALEAKGLPDRAIKAMDDFRFNFADRPEYWVRIARLYENVGELEQALACLEQLNRLKAMTLDDGVRQAKLLWRLLRPDAALTRLIGLRGQARETETDYWRLVGSLAWRVENDLLAAEAFGVLRKTEKTADVAEPLFRSLETLKRSDEAIAVAEEAYKRLGISSFLVAAVDLAVRQGMLDRAKGLFAQASGKEKQFALETHFWFQRAQLAISEEKYGQAETDLQRVLAIDPGSEDAHIEWLTLALHAQDRGMAERALRHWGPAAEEDSESWGLLADAYGLLGEDDRALRFRRLYREERTRQRIASGRPMTPEEHIEEAVERRDRRAVENGLRLYGTTLSLPMRVSALRELGRDEDAWDLLDQAGLLREGAKAASPEDTLALAADIRDLRETYLDGIWAFGGANSIGDLEERRLGARFELRFGRFFVGAEGGTSRLISPERPALIAKGDAENRAFLHLRLHERFGETRAKAGFQFLPEGRVPTFELGQRLSLFTGKFELNARGVYGEIPAYLSLLRVAALRDALELDMVAAIAGPLEIGLAGAVSRLITRGNDAITNEKSGRAELAIRLPFRTFYLRPRFDATTTSAPALNDIPATFGPLLTGQEDPDNLLALGYSAVGLGFGIGSTFADVGEAKGPHVSLRYQLDGWGGYVFPAQQPSYAVDFSLGLVFARHQELSVETFYYSDLRSAAGEAYWGGTLNYTLRWFR